MSYIQFFKKVGTFTLLLFMTYLLWSDENRVDHWIRLGSYFLVITVFYGTLMAVRALISRRYGAKSKFLMFIDDWF